ncbi:MAG: hypothetical protein ACOYMR_03620, partial [Ilumatobacteraceae bacterium]
ISSGLAFAYNAPTIDVAMGASVSNTGTIVSLGVQPGSASCSGSSTNVDGTADVISFEVTLTTVSIESDKHFGAAGFNSTSLANAATNDFTAAPYTTTITNPPNSLSGGVTFSFGIRKFNPGPPANTTGVVLVAGDAFRAQMKITYSCTYAGGSATTFETIDGIYTYVAAGQPWSFSPGGVV